MAKSAIFATVALGVAVGVSAAAFQVVKAANSTDCDSPATVETVKQLALKKLQTGSYAGVMNTYVLGGAISGAMLYLPYPA